MLSRLELVVRCSPAAGHVATKADSDNQPTRVPNATEYDRRPCDPIRNPVPFLHILTGLP